ncbi:Threonine/homoserine efflux transporter RhtA [Streptoalloteichus hindustanus]|uniref:Threonine/homoserine efflux transporter RhtA n=2 Tax=Streptoalloteichus hindustanus TaxID=2017 RepID=A0A1M5IV61_STRHI|nr:Threonine/homoserine efflux transporter RhtA [Streptoalloteichus hindustanus]
MGHLTQNLNGVTDLIESPTAVRHRGSHSGVMIITGAVATTIVGASVPVTGLLDGYPVLSGQAVRYAIGGVALLAWALITRQRVPLPSGRDLVALALLAATGMLGFSACVLAAQRHAEPGFVAAVVGASPLVLALVGPLTTGRRPRVRVVAGAVLVVAGVVTLSGGGTWGWAGLGLAALALVGEALFTLLAVRPVARIGALGVSTWACFVAAAEGAVVATVTEGAAAWRVPDATEALALVVLGVIVTAVAYICWYSCVSRVGADRAGVLVGLMPVSGVLASLALGAQSLSLLALAGALVVAVGCALGLG